MNYRFLLEARWDLFDADDWYNGQLPGLGVLFTDQVEDRVREIAARPRLYGRVDPPVRGREVRQALVRRFPFTVIYEVAANEVIIVAVIHVRSSGRRWRRRLSSRQP
jgi:plasmid stabilization system protein ParE